MSSFLTLIALDFSVCSQSMNMDASNLKKKSIKNKKKIKLSSLLMSTDLSSILIQIGQLILNSERFLCKFEQRMFLQTSLF